MIFSSLIFLSAFLPFVYLLYVIVPSIKAKNILLIIASLLFYAYGEPVYVFLMIFSALLNYVCARMIDLYKNKKMILTIAVVLNIGILGIFKYSGFLITSLNDLLGSSLIVPQITLPIGISFFTFQALSYVIDVYRKDVKSQKNFLKVLLYISFFPQLIAGPIVKYHDISEEINDRQIDFNEAAQGMRRFICGLGKKVLIANTVGAVADQIFMTSFSNINVLSAWLGAISYLLQIYYDFSGYSDMAIGLGQMFGFHFKENFMYPYTACTIKEFWRRWHISLSTWFKEYLYIPLGGNRKGKIRTCLNKFIVFFTTGLWHGANWTFVVWGLYHGMFSFLEEFIPSIQKLPKFILHIYTLVVVTVGFVIFRCDTLSQAAYFITSMFTGFYLSIESMSIFYQQLTPWFICILIVAVIGATPIQGVLLKVREKINCDDSILTRKWIYIKRISYLLSFLLLIWCMIRLSGNTYNPFIYFRF